jgi:hypothetical protein
MTRKARVVSGLVALAGLAVAAVSVPIGVAAWLVREPWSFLVALEKSATRGDRDALLARYARVQRAQAWQPDDPHLDELAARYAVALAAADPSASGHWHERALSELRDAVAVRPRWPYAWAALALVKAGRAEYDAELATAVREALANGPQERRVRRQIAGLFVTEAPERVPEVAAALERAFVAELALEPRLWIDRADQHGKGEAICARKDLPAAAVARCTQLRWR